MASLAGYSLANLLGELHAGRNPRWREQALLESPPVNNNDGIGLGNASDGVALRTGIQIRVRRVAAYRTAIFTFTVDNSQTYAISIDVGAGAVAFNYASDASATSQEIADGLKAALEATALNDNLLAYSELDPDGSGEYRLRVTGKPGSALDADDFSITAWSAGGAGDIDVEADPSHCHIVIWGLPSGGPAVTSPADPDDAVAYRAFDATEGDEETSPWMQIALVTEPSALPEDALEGEVYVPFSGYIDMLNTGILARLAVQVSSYEDSRASSDHADVEMIPPRVLIGPAWRETEGS